MQQYSRWLNLSTEIFGQAYALFLEQNTAVARRSERGFALSMPKCPSNTSACAGHSSGHSIPP